MNYIKLTEAQAIELNDILYEVLVSDDDGQTFKFPFQAGTVNYINPTAHSMAYPIDSNMISIATDNATVAGLIAGTVSYAQALANGWLPEPV